MFQSPVEDSCPTDPPTVTPTEVPPTVTFQSPVEDSCPTDMFFGAMAVPAGPHRFQSPVEDSCPTDATGGQSFIAQAQSPGFSPLSRIHAPLTDFCTVPFPTTPD